MPCDDDDSDDDGDGDDGDNGRCVQSMMIVVYRHSDTNPNSDRDDKEYKHWLASDIQNLGIHKGTVLIDLPQIQKQIHFFFRADLALTTAPPRC